MSHIADSYVEANQNDHDDFSNVITGQGQSFTPSGTITLETAKFYLAKTASPTGNAVCKIYAHSGVYGTSSVPTGAALATSDNFDVSTLSTSLALITFNFSGVNQITLTQGVNYVLTMEYSGGTGTNKVQLGMDTTSPSHGGNDMHFSAGSWSALSSRDNIFYVTGSGPSSSISASPSSSPSASVSLSPSASPSSGSGAMVVINGVDYTPRIKAYSLKIENILTNKRDTAEFTIQNHSGYTNKPNLGSEVIMYDGADKIFGGVIVNMESVAGALGIVEHRIYCQDYTRLLDHMLIPDAFENELAEDIITTLKTNYFPAGFTINNVDAPVLIKYVQFKYRPLAQCLQELANAINYDWYVDYDKDVHFFAKETVTAPFDLADNDGSYIYDSLIIRRDNSQIRNSIIVRGGEYIGSQLTADIQTNGVDFYFPLPYRFADFASHITGHVLSLGIDNIDSPDNFDALYNFQEKILKFKSSDTPSANKTLKVSGKPYLPVIVRYRSPSSIASMMSAEGGDGEYQYLIQDKSINSKEGARQRAQAEILAYATTLSEGEFITESSGLRAGMAIRVVSSSRGIDEVFIINKVVINQFTDDTFIYKVSLITTRTMDLIDVLQKLLLASTKDIVIDPNETTEVIFQLDDTIDFTDTLGTFSTHGTSYKWGVSTDIARWNNAAWS